MASLVVFLFVGFCCLLGTTFSVADSFCPQHCKCVTEGVAGIDAHCTELNADEQFFLKPVQHITIMNENKTQMALTDNIFSKLGLRDVESIKIVNSSLADISVNAFNGLASLFDVNLSDNRLFLIHPDTFANNTNLHNLKLSGNPLQLTQLLQSPHDYLLRSKSLTEFDISFCQLSQILPLTFSQMRNLIFVNLAWNYLKVIPRDVFRELIYLEELDVSYNLISKIEKDAFRSNQELSVLKLKKNPIEYMKGINIPGLDELDMSECKISLLMRESLEGMPELTHVNFSYNKIEILSEDAFYDLKNLKQLDLSYNNLVGPLPQGIFSKNFELETLLLSGNTELKTLVDDAGFMGNHPALIRLDVASCGLTALNGNLFSGMNNLNILNVNNNSLKYVNNTVFRNLTRLIQLDLSNNLIESLEPSLFSDNSQLLKLVISGNPILELPVLTFVNLPNLKLLDASNCQLIKLWDNHKHVLKQLNVLSNLAYLDLSKNNMKNLHVYDFSTFAKLEKVHLSGNPLECVKTTIDVIEYLMNKQVDPYYEKQPKVGFEDKFKWNELINDICPVKAIDAVEATAGKEEPAVISTDGLLSRHPLEPRRESTFLNEIVVEDENGTMVWQAVLVIVIILVIVYLIAYFIGEITNRRRCVSAYIKPGTLGGHIRTRGSSGTPLYYKLYEECSIPTQPPSKKKSILISFTPIHTLLKKGSYKIMKNNEVHL